MARKSKHIEDEETQDGILAGQEIANERQKFMEKKGLGLDYLLVRIKYLCEATKPISCVKGKDADGGTVDFIDVPDNAAIAKGVDLGLNVGGFYPPKELKADINHSGNIMATVIEALNDGKRASK